VLRLRCQGESVEVEVSEFPAFKSKSIQILQIRVSERRLFVDSFVEIFRWSKPP
jgi:hypothetical protein